MVVQNGNMFSANGALQLFQLTNNATMNPATHETSDNLCKYPSKKCFNPRVIKRNGELHNFCEYHRQKANENQRRMEHRRKLNRLLARQQNVMAAASASATVTAATDASLTAATSEVMEVCQSQETFSVTGLSKTILDDSAFHRVDLSPQDMDVSVDTDFEYIDLESVDFGLALGSEEIDMEPSNQPFELLEEDLFFLDHFMEETCAF